ncbi:MAG: Modulator protein MzrA [Sodalis sp.]|nr:MAG: Modulator protein MzrA [Sodalis sp.]
MMKVSGLALRHASVSVCWRWRCWMLLTLLFPMLCRDDSMLQITVANEHGSLPDGFALSVS